MRFVQMRHPKVKGEATIPVSAVAHYERAGWVLTESAQTPGLTITQVLADVGDDPVKAAAALEAEQASDNPRSTLVEKLSRIQNQES